MVKYSFIPKFLSMKIKLMIEILHNASFLKTEPNFILKLCYVVNLTCDVHSGSDKCPTLILSGKCQFDDRLLYDHVTVSCTQ